MYIVIIGTENGPTTQLVSDEKDLLKLLSRLSEDYCISSPVFLKYYPDLETMQPGSIFIFKGKVVLPQPKQVVLSYTLDS